MTSALTDFYQFTISLAYFREGRQDETACFDLFYRRQPFRGSFAIFGGLDECIRFIQNYRLTEDELSFVRANLPGDNDDFIDYLRRMDMRKLRITAIPEGSVVFPREPLLRIEGPIAYCQLIETPLLNCVNFATLMATNALRFRLRAGADKTLMEFGLRRAQGPDGAISASRYSYLGLFDSTSNVLAGQRFGIPVAGTVAHSFITSYFSVEQLATTRIACADGSGDVDLFACAQQVLSECGFRSNESELVAFIAQALVFPRNFLALVDTYDTLKSGVPNFLAVSYGLHRAGYRGKGVRLDSGDNVELSKAVRRMYCEFAEKYGIPYAAKYLITASNDINEGELIRIGQLGHEIDSFGIGTHLVTCQAQPALGGVYKLVEIDGVPRVKLSESIEKSTIPCKKDLYRCFDEKGVAVADILTVAGEVPEQGRCYKVFPGTGECELKCAEIRPLYIVAWDNGRANVDSLQTARERVMDNYKNFNKDVLTVGEPKEYPLLTTPKLYQTMEELIRKSKI